MKKKRFIIEYIPVGTPEKSAAIVKQLARGTVQKVLNQHGATSPNLNEVLDKYITTVPADE